MQKFRQHVKSFNHAWVNIVTEPLEHLINIVVLALIIALCTVGISLNNNLKTWQQKNVTYPQMMLYLDKAANQADVANIEKVLNSLSGTAIKNYQFISKEQGLVELQKDQQDIVSDVIESGVNPLPDVFIVNTSTSESSVLEGLSMQLKQLPMVNTLEMDSAYAGKISALLSFSTQVILSAQILLIIVLTLVVYNMIRLQMLIKSDAIQVSRLIGASDSFIMRPLIHYAVWQVTIATVVAYGALYHISGRINHLLSNFSNLFGSGIHFNMLSPLQFFTLWIILVIFTIFTVFLAVRWVFNHNQSN